MSSIAEIETGQRLLNSIRTGNYKEFHNCLANGPASQLTEKDFRTSRKNMQTQFGGLKNFRFMTDLKTPAVRNLIWITAFERRGSGGKVISQELLFRLVAGRADGKPAVLSFVFF